MDLSFRTRKLEKLANSGKEQQKQLGTNAAKKFKRRLDDLRATRNLAEMAFLPRLGAMAWATSAGVMPAGNSRALPSGNVREMGAMRLSSSVWRLRDARLRVMAHFLPNAGPIVNQRQNGGSTPGPPGILMPGE